MLSERLLQLLTAYVDGEVTAYQRRVVLRHLRKSAETRAFLKKLQDDANEIRQLPARKAGQDLSQRILERIGDQVVVRPIRIPLGPAPSSVPRGFGLATAAAVLLALGFGSVYYLRAIREKDPPIAVVPPEAPPTEFAAKDNKVNDTKVEVAAAPKPDLAAPTTVAKNDEKKQEQPPAQPSIKDAGSVLATPVPPPPGHFEIANVKVAMTLASRDLLEEKPRLRLLERLHKEDAQHIDLYCKQTRTALERVERAFKEQGVHFVLAPDAIDPYLLRPRNTDYVLFTESVKPEEVLAVLQQVADQDRVVESRKGKGQFQDVLVNAVSKRDHDLLSKILGIDATQLQPAKPAAPLGVDIRKPMALQTAEAVVKSLEGKGGVRRPQPGMTPAKQPAVKSPERLVVVGTCNPINPRPESSEVKRFLESRKQRSPETMQMLMILRQGK